MVPAPEGLTNAVIAGRLDEVARLLEEQGANPYRVRAYRLGAGTLRGLPMPVSEIFTSEGFAGLERLPAVGPGLAAAIGSLLTHGRLPMLDRLRGEVGNLPPAPALAVPASPPVAELLSVDREYRTRAAAGELVKIAPKKENPDHVAWLPILHTHRLNRDYTALYSNTPRAHQLGRTQDWVVLYVDGDRPALQYTVITPHRGPLAGMRVVRGREAECLELVARRRHRRRRAPKTGSGEIK